MIKKLTATFTFIYLVLYSFAQNDANPMLVGLLKQQLKELKENPPTLSDDDIMNSAPPFIPKNGKIEGEGIVNTHLDSIIKNTEISTGEASLIETGNGELRIDLITLKPKWMHVPYWQDMYANISVSSIINSKGEEIRLPDSKYQEYMENGYIQNEGMYGFANGESETKVYLNSEPKSTDFPLNLKGELSISFPTEYNAYTFSVADTGKTIKMGAYAFTFISMEKNTVIYRVVGPRGFNDAYKIHCTNKEDKLFNGRNGTSFDYAFYNEAKKNNFELPDNKINEFVINIQKNSTNENLDQLYIQKVQGSFHKITFYNVISTGEKIIPINLVAAQ